MKKLNFILIGMIFILILSACGNNDPSAYDAGIEALHNKDLEEAIEQFNTSAESDDENAEQAAQYLEVIDKAQSISALLDDESYDEAIENYDAIKTSDYFADIYFVIQEDLETLQTVIESRANIDGQLNILTDLIGAKIDAIPIYEELLEKISEEPYLSDAQKETIKSLEADVKALKGDDDSSKEETEAPASESEDESTDTNTSEDENEEKENASKNENKENSQGTPNNEASGNASEKAYNLAYNFVIEQGIVSKAMLDNGNVKLNMDHQDSSGAYVFQLFEVVSDGGSGHTATWGWYSVNVESGTVTEAF